MLDDEAIDLVGTSGRTSFNVKLSSTIGGNASVSVRGGATLNVTGDLNVLATGGFSLDTTTGVGNAVANIGGNLTNAGFIDFISDAANSANVSNLKLNETPSAGTFTNLASGNLHIYSGATFNMPLINQGVMEIDQSVLMSVGTLASGDFTNSGTLSLFGSLTLGKNLFLMPNSVINLSINGTGQVAGTDFGQITGTGVAKLAEP